MAIFDPRVAPRVRHPGPFTGVPLPRFGGLNLRDDPAEVGWDGAIDLLNVTFTERGAVKTRDGYDPFTTVKGTNRYDSLGVFYTTAGTRQLVCGAGARIEALDTSGAITGTPVTTATASPHYFARFGGPGAERLYIANGADTVRYWDGAAFTTPAYTGTTPDGRFLAVTPWDNRLVSARMNGTSAGDNVSSVRFSNPGEPHTFGANDYIDLEPGDGEQIMGVVAWGERVFVFKESKFFVFYGTTTDSAGDSEFLYTPMETGVGLASSKAICAGRDGVYFMSRTGVYRTDGGTPTPVSSPVEPIWSGQASGFFVSGTLNHGQITDCAMCWHDERVFLSLPSGAATAPDRLLVHDPDDGWWSLWDLPAAAMASFRISDEPELVFAYSTGLEHIGRHSSAYTDDDGAAITSRWRSGWSDLGDPDVKLVRETKLWGSGTVRVALGRDFTTSGPDTLVDFDATSDRWGDGTGSDVWGDGTGTDTWGSGRSLTGKLARRSIVGTAFSVELESTSAFSLSRLALHRRGPRRGPSTLGMF